MNNFYQDEIKRIMSLPDSDRDEEIPKELWGLPLSLGNDAENEEEYAYAFCLLLELSARKNARIRALAVLGLAYLARTNGRLDRGRVEPLIRREWRANAGCPENRGTLSAAVDDINFFLGWGLRLSDGEDG